MKRLALATTTAMVATFLIAPAAIAQKKPKPPQSVRLYVFDCGLLTMSNPATFGFTKEEIAEKQPFCRALVSGSASERRADVRRGCDPGQPGQRDRAGNLDGHENSEIAVGGGRLLGRITTCSETARW